MYFSCFGSSYSPHVHPLDAHMCSLDSFPASTHLPWLRGSVCLCDPMVGLMSYAALTLPRNGSPCGNSPMSVLTPGVRVNTRRDVGLLLHLTIPCKMPPDLS